MSTLSARPEPDRQRQTPPGLRCRLTPAAAYFNSHAEYVEELNQTNG